MKDIVSPKHYEQSFYYIKKSVAIINWNVIVYYQLPLKFIWYICKYYL